MRIATQFSVFLINKPGVLAAVTGALAEANVNMSALALMDSGEHGALRLVCDNSETARKVLAETHDRWTETDVLVLDLSNRPGSFADIARVLAEAGVNITYAYCTSGERDSGTLAVFKIADLPKAMDVLKAANV